MKSKLDNELKNLPKNSVVLTILPAEHYEELNMHLVKNMISESGGGVYVTLQRPYENLINLMVKQNITILQNQKHLILK